MRVLFFIGELRAGGAERQLQILARAFSENGHEVVVVTLFPTTPSLGDLGLHVHLLSLGQQRSSFVGRRMVQMLAAPWRLRKWIRRICPDVIYSMLHLSNLIAWIATRSERSDRLVWGYRASNVRLNFKQYVPEKFCCWVSSSVPLMIANSYAGAHFATDVRGHRPRRLEVVPNGIDSEFFRPCPVEAKRLRKALGIVPTDVVVGIVARIDPIKGHEIFLKAAECVLRQNASYHFLIVGEGPRQRVAALKALAAALGIADKVCWVGHRTDTPVVYSAIDILCSCSYGEGHSNVIGEAMACGTPCVVTDVGDSADIVGSLGRVVPAGDIGALSGELLAAGCWGAKIVEEDLRNHIRERFSIGSLYKSTLYLLQDIDDGQ